MYNLCLMLPKIKKIVDEVFPQGEGKALLVGVSGGADSICLLDSLHILGLPVIAAHVNHGLRAQAVADARFVEEFARARRIPFVEEAVDVKSMAAEEGLSLEEAARNLRYRLLFRWAEERGAWGVVTAHTADDQVETVLMHFLRGAGLDGLKGMPLLAQPNPWRADLPLFRPLLTIWREEIIGYLEMRNLRWVTDETNADTAFFRNRLRHELLPLLTGYNPHIREAVFRTAQTLSGDLEVLEQAAEQALLQAKIESGKGYIGLRGEVLRALLPGQQRRVLRLAIKSMLPALRDIDFEHIERARDFLLVGKAGAWVDLAARLRLYKEGEALWLATWETELPQRLWPEVLEEAVLTIPGTVALANGWQFTATRLSGGQVPREYRETTDPQRVFLSAQAVAAAGEFTLRARQPGDRFRPLGMDGHAVKLSDFMINNGIARRARSRWPLVCVGQDIAWVAGYRLSHDYRIQDVSQDVIQLALIQTNPEAFS